MADKDPKHPVSFEELAQHTPPVTNPADELAADIWTDDELDAFLESLRRGRQDR